MPNLNHNSLSYIAQIANELRTKFPEYSYNTFWYDETVGVYAIEVKKDGNNINLYLFYADEIASGLIGSIAIYGLELESHLKTILATKNIFGLKVKNAFLDRQGIQPFVDVYIDNNIMLLDALLHRR